jgi:hypothetical protein
MLSAAKHLPQLLRINSAKDLPGKERFFGFASE